MLTNRVQQEELEGKHQSEEVSHTQKDTNNPITVSQQVEKETLHHTKYIEIKIYCSLTIINTNGLSSKIKNKTKNKQKNNQNHETNRLD